MSKKSAIIIARNRYLKVAIFSNGLKQILTFREDASAPDELCFFFDQRNVPLFIPPQSFLQTDRTNNYIFRDPIVSKKDMRQLVIDRSNTRNTIGVNRRRRLAFTIEVKFEENGKTNIPTAVHDCLRPDEDTILRSQEAIKLRFGTRLYCLKSLV